MNWMKNINKMVSKKNNNNSQKNYQLVYLVLRVLRIRSKILEKEDIMHPSRFDSKVGLRSTCLRFYLMETK